MKAYFNKIFIAFLTLGFLALSACQVDNVVDPDNPSLASVTSNASKPQLQLLVTGLEAQQRRYLANAVQMFGTFGREVWPYFGSDPRFLNDWLGIGKTETYPDFFASTGTYVSPYQAVKQANVLIEAAANSSFVNDSERKGYTGFAKTIKAFQLIFPLMQQYQNGIRVDVSETLNPGPTLSYNDALKAIRQIMDDGYNDLKSAGSAFSFSLTSGFSGFDTPAGMIQVNRAIAARLALYDEDWQGALSALNESFMNLNASTPEEMNVGPAHVWGDAPDVNNPLYYPYDKPTNTILIVHPALIEDALPGDQRVAVKFAKRLDNPLETNALRDADGNLLVGEYQDARWATNTSPTPFIRNEELILIYAEANVRLNKMTEAVNAINTIRNTWGVGNYTGATDTDSLIEEILFQRRYSLWGEGQRWIDLRRTGRLDSNHVDLRDRGNIFMQVARRTSETNWDAR